MKMLRPRASQPFPRWKLSHRRSRNSVIGPPENSAEVLLRSTTVRGARASAQAHCDPAVWPGTRVREYASTRVH